MAGLAASDRNRPIVVGGAMPPPANDVRVMGPDGEDDQDQTLASITVHDDGGVSITVGPDEPEEPENTGPDPSFDRNLAEDISEDALSQLASDLFEAIEADIQARQQWLDTTNLAAAYLGVDLRDPDSAPSADGSLVNTQATDLLEALIKTWSTSRSELLPVGGPVKVAREDMPVPPEAAAEPAAGPTPPSSGAGGGVASGAATPPTPPPGGIAGAGPAPGIGHNGGPPLDRDKLANALERDMNWYLTKGDREYYPDVSRMLLSRDLIGMAFRKVYKDPIKRKPRSVWVRAQDLVVSNDCLHLSGASRITEMIRMPQARMRRMQAAGHYLDIPLVMPSGDPTPTEEAIAEAEGVEATPDRPDDREHMVYETLVDLDSFMAPGLEKLDRDETGRKPGYPLPYRVSMDKDSQKILEIRRAWRKGDPHHERRTRYVKYGFIPGLGFYDFGLIHICGNPTLAATMLERSAVDGALYANFPGGLKAEVPGDRQNQSVYRPNPGEFMPIRLPEGKSIKDVVMAFPYPPPSAQSLALRQGFSESVKRLAGQVTVPVGEAGVGNTPVGTMMAFVESMSQVPGAVHKDDHVTQAEEFELLRELLAEEPQVLWRGNRTPAHRWELAEELMAPDISPAADPNTPSAVHRLMKLQAKVTMAAMPIFTGIADARAIWAQSMELLGSGPNDCTLPPQPQGAAPPDPRIVAAQIKAESDKAKVAGQMQKDQLDHQQRQAEMAMEAQQRDADRDSEETRAAMSLEAARLREASGTHNAAADRMHDTLNQAADRAMEHQHHMHDAAMQQHQQAVDTATAAAQPDVPPAGGEGGQ